MLKH
jgi:hypothetical protein